jgi:hypothetical protein
MEVKYYHAYIDGVDFVFIDNPVFHYVQSEIYGGDQTVSIPLHLLILFSLMTLESCMSFH